MTIHGQLTAADHAEARRLQLVNSIIDTSLGLAGTLLLLLWQQRSLFKAGFVQWWAYLPFGCFGFLVALLAGCWLVALRSTRPPQSETIFRSVAYLQAPREIRLTPLGLAIASPALNITLRWKEDFRSYQIGEHVILVFQPRGHLQIFAKRWFTEPELTEFLSILHTALGAPRPFGRRAA